MARRGHKGAPTPPAKVEDFKGTMLTLLSYLKPHRFKIVVVFLFAMISTIFAIVSPAILGQATDVIVSGLTSGNGIAFGALGKVIVLLIGLYVVSFIFSASQSYIMSGISQMVTYELREKMSAKMDRLPLRYYDSKTNGEIQSRFVNDIETINQTLSQSIAQTITSVTTLIGILAMMIKINLIMTLVTLMIVPFTLLIMKSVISRSQPQFKKQQENLGALNGHIEEMFGGHNVVKAFNKEEASLEKFQEINDKLCENSWKSQFLSGLMMPLTVFVANIGYVAICIIGGNLALQGKISIGEIQAFIQYVRSFNQPLNQVSQIANMLQSTAAAAERIFQFIDEEEEIDPWGLEDENKYHMDIKDLKGQVSFNDVYFGYKKDEPVIKGFSYDAKPGDRIAIVGPTGAGKTTIIKLLLRYYELDGGSISIDGHNIKDFSRYDLREMFGMVLQDSWLFSGTMEENIKYGNANATMDDVVKAAKDAHIHHHIMTLPEGYNTQINESASNISQGEKQLLTIARALLADNPILILDEATSSVDTRTEKIIQEAMLNLMENRTCFIIAHRLSTIKDADHILVMNHGDIIEQGTHDQLLAENGFYANLYNSQFAEE
ncbi:MAG: ABC transporter ATP-binding protein [Eubacterium sp.]|nr:ABC transporter ATP-binding protein [Eubacterium sp.]